MRWERSAKRRVEGRPPYAALFRACAVNDAVANTSTILPPPAAATLRSCCPKAAPRPSESNNHPSTPSNEAPTLILLVVTVLPHARDDKLQPPKGEVLVPWFCTFSFLLAVVNIRRQGRARVV